MGDLNPFDRAANENERAAAEAAGLLNHIIPDLRPLAVPLSVLNLDPTNAQEHDPRNLKVIAGSFQAYGQREALTVNWDDKLIANRITVGNGRYVAAKMLGWTWIAAVGTEDTEDDAMAWGMLDNRSSALSKMNYSQAGQNAKRLKTVGHPVLELMYTDDEVLPLLHETFEIPQQTEEQFDASMLRGRAISKITASERLIVDQAIELKRAQHSKALTEGAALELICREYLEITAASVPTNGQIATIPETVVEDDVLPIF
jgi:hypothetical protein